MNTDLRHVLFIFFFGNNSDNNEILKRFSDDVRPTENSEKRSCTVNDIKREKNDFFGDQNEKRQTVSQIVVQRILYLITLQQDAD